MRRLIFPFLVLLAFGGAAGASGPPPDGLASVDLAPDAFGREPAEKAALPSTQAISTLYTRQVTSAVQHEVETGITALALNGVDYTIGAFMNNYQSTGYPDLSKFTWEIRTRYSINLTSWTERIPAKPAGATSTVDPVLAANVYSGASGGVSPLTVYLGGLATNGTNRKIVVWRSTDGGNAWSQPVTVAASTTGSVLVDKPTIAVSWHPSFRGHVFVAYALVRGQSFNRHLNEIYVARSTDGGQSFGTPVQVAQSYVHTPQVVVSSGSGKVYVVYTDHTANKIRMAASSNQGATWTIEDVASPTGKFLEVWDDPYINGGGVCSLQAITVPHARYNWVRDSLGIVWHERQGTAMKTSTDVWFIAKTASGWTNKVRVNPIQDGDQWMPALDFDSAGNYLVVFYDRSADPSNVLFKEAWAQVNPLYPTPSILASGSAFNAFASNPTTFHQVSQGVDKCFKGEYQDVWFWPYTDRTGPRFNSLWTGSTSPTVFDNVYVSGFQP